MKASTVLLLLAMGTIWPVFGVKILNRFRGIEAWINHESVIQVLASLFFIGYLVSLIVENI